MLHKITIIRVRKTLPDNVNEELQYIGDSLGLFNLRDRNSSCFRIFIVLLKKAKFDEISSSDEIADRLGLTRGTVVHHLNMLRDSGLVIREKGGYILRERNLEKLILEIKRDLNSTMDHLIDVAKIVDQKLG